jgi:hypothetical protein
MESKKINQLATNLAPVNTDLTVIGDPLTGELKKITLLQIASLFGAGLTSVGMVVPSGFSVSPASLTSSGTFTITGAGTTSQYIDGTGALQTFPTLLASDKLIHLVRNNSGATISKGTIVYINGALGNKPTIAKALATSDATSAQTYGVVQADIANNADGNIVVIGDVENLDTSAVTEGTQLYLSGTTAGAYTTTKTYAPTHLVYIAVVLRSHPTLGIIGVKIQNGYEMDELHNVSAQSPANNDGLFYNSTTSLWEKNTIAGVLGYTPVTSARTISTTSPLSGGGDLSANRTLSIAQATTSASGYLSSTDWNTFNNKQSTITLTVTGSSGASTFSAGTLNVPTYTLSGLGGQPLATNLTNLSGLTFVSTSFVKMTASGTFGLDTNTYYLASNPSGYTSNVGTVTSVAALTLGTTGTDLSSSVATGTTTPVITLNVPTASATNRGVLSSTDWSTFNSKQGTITLTTTGSSGSATLVTNTLNIPTYTLAGLGGQASSTNLTSLSGLTYVSASFVKMTASGTFSLDTSTYLTANQTITLSGDVSGSGTTAITTAIGTNKVTNAMLSQIATGTFHGRVTAGTGNIETLTGTQATTLLDTFTSLLKGLAPASGGGTTNFLRADGTWAAPAGSGSVTSVSIVSANGFAGSVATATTTPAITLTTSITGLLKGNGTAISTATSGTDYQAPSTNLTSISGLTYVSASFVKMTAAGTFSLDTNTYYLASNPSGYTNNTGTVTSVAALTLGTSGTDLSSSVATGTTTPVITLNVPTASSTNRGALSSTDWSTFNGKENSLTFSSPLSRATNTISIPAATTSVNGYLTSTDWNTFNGKFTLPSFTSGSILFSNGTTIAQDNASFFWDDTNNRLGIGTATPSNPLDVVRGTAGTMARGFYESASVSYNADTKFGIYTASATATDGAALYLGQTNLLNSSSQYGGFELQYRYNSSTTENLRINYVSRLATGAVSTSTSDLLLISKTGAATFLSSVTATSFVKTSGTSAQILAADGSVITAGTNITISGGTISASGGGVNFYTTDGTLTSARTITAAGFSLTYSDNKVGQAAITISNTTAGSTSASGLIMTSDASSGNGLIAKVSSTYTTSALVTSNDLALINYTAGDIIVLNTFTSGLIKFGVGTSTSAQMTLTNDGHLLIGTTTNGTNFLDVNGNTNIGGTLYVTYPNSTRPSINFATSGTLRSLPLTGDMEMDGTGKLYFTHNDSERGVIPAYQFFKPNTAIALNSGITTAQPIFNTITNGAVTLKSATNYVFEMLLYITGMSTTSGTFGIAFGGAATITTIAWQTLGSKVNNIGTTASHQSTFNITTSNATLVTASAFATGYMRVWGNVRINAGGTFIPQITLGVASAASIQPQSYFRITALSAGSVDYIGNWS